MDIGHDSKCLSTKMSPSDTDSSVSISSQKCEASAASEATPSTVLSDSKLQSQSFLGSNISLKNQKGFVSSDLKVLSADCVESGVNEEKVVSDGKQVDNIPSVHTSCASDSSDCAQISLIKDELNIESNNNDELGSICENKVDSSEPFLISEECILESEEFGAEEKPVSTVDAMKLQAAVQPQTSTAVVAPVANKESPLSSIEAISSKYIKIAPKLDSSNVGSISILIPNQQRQKINQNSGVKLNNISTLILSNESNANVQPGPSILHTLLLTNESNNHLVPVDGKKLLTSDKKVQCLKQKAKRVVKTKPLKKTVSKSPGVPGALRIPSTLTIIPQPVSVDIPARDVSIHNVPVSVCDNLPKKQLSEISNSVKDVNVFNRLRKLGTIVEVENKDKSLNDCGNGYVPLPVSVNTVNKPPLKTNRSNIKTQCLKMIESLAEADVILTDLTKKKKKKNLKKGEVNEEENKSVNADKIKPSKNVTSSGTINSETKKFHFQLNSSNIMELSEGQKVFACDICSAVYYRSFSLKRHYLKSHINYKHISQRDLHNCRIIIREPVPEENKTKEKNVKTLSKNESSRSTTKNTDPKISNLPDLYQCHTCWACFCDKSDLKLHLMEHPPVSLMSMKKNPLKAYRCINCNVTFHHKKQFSSHKEACNRENPSHLCFYCDDSFPSLMSRRKHQFKVHHPKKKLHQCFLCKMKMFKDVHNLFKHLVTQHADEYSGCVPCKLRFVNKSELKKHNQVEHNKSKINNEKKSDVKFPGKAKKIKKLYERIHYEKVTGGSNGVLYKCNVCSKTFNLYLNLCRHHHAAHASKIMKKKEIRPKCSNNEAKENDDATHDNSQTNTNNHVVPVSPPPDPETLFFSRVASNIRENLLHHLDGKLDSQEVMEYDLNSNTSTRSKILNFSATFMPEKESSGEEKQSVHSDKSNQQSAKITPEKFNFPKNYDGRCGLTLYIKDMSHLDISTQMTMRRNLQRLSCLSGEETNKDKVEDIPSGLSLVNRGGAEFAAMFGEPVVDEGEGEGEGGLELSGEWTRPRSYICAACGFKSSGMWEVEEHKAALHPNVWCPHIEVVGENSSSWDWIYCQKVTLQGALSVPCNNSQSSSLSIPKCSKCQKQSASLPDLHRHLLECGGDITWMTTMLAVVSPGSRKSKKWRPFGSRRRRQGNRALKRTIPNTPVKHSCGKIRTKPGDTDTIQKMIANLPPKRATRKVIGDENDIKTRSQATINSVPFSVVTFPNRSRPENMHGKNVKLKSNNNQSTLAVSKKLKTENGDKSKEDNNKSKKHKKNGNVNGNTLLTNNMKKEIACEIKQDDMPVNFDCLKLEREDTVQHEDILTSLQVMPVANKVEPNEPEPFDASKVIAAMRVAMMDSIEQQEKGLKKKDKKKRPETDKKKVVDDVNTDEELIICNGCGMQFDNASACQRHRKKCVYYKDNKILIEKANQCFNCSSSFPHAAALNKHNCNKLDSNDDRKMPQLRREEPVEETHCDDADDIPVLSPEDVSKDVNDIKPENNFKNNSVIPNDEKTRRLSLLEITINEVANESFDIDAYKSCKALNEALQDMFTKSELKQTCNKRNHVRGKNLTGCEDATAIQEHKEETATIEGTVKKNIKLVSKGKTENKSKLEKILETKNIKTAKDLPKPQESKKKKRSTSLALFLKEVEKLEEEGVIVLGKRRRKECAQKYDVLMDSQKSKSEETVASDVEKKENSLNSNENKEENSLNNEENKKETSVNSEENVKTECEYNEDEDALDINQKKTRGRQKRFVQMEITETDIQNCNVCGKREDKIDPKMGICKKVYGEAYTSCENRTCLPVSSKDCTEKTKHANTDDSQNDDKSEHHSNIDSINAELQIADDIEINKEVHMNNGNCVKETRLKKKSKKMYKKDVEIKKLVGSDTENALENSKSKKSKKTPITIDNKQFKCLKKGKVQKRKSSLSTSIDNRVLKVDNVCEDTDKSTLKNGKQNVYNNGSSNNNSQELLKGDSESSARISKSKGLKRKLDALQGINGEQKEQLKKVKKIKLCDEIGTKVDVHGKSNFEKKRVLTVKEKLVNKKKYKIKKLWKKKDGDLTVTYNKSGVLAGDSIEFDKIKRKKKIKIGPGVARNKWEVSVISVDDSGKKGPTGEFKQSDVQIQSEENDIKKSEVTKFFCSYCDVSFPTAFGLYEHKLSAAHGNKEVEEPDKKIEVTEPLLMTEDNEVTVKCCKSLQNVISDLEKRTLTVAKVVNKLKQRDSTDSYTEDIRTNGANSVAELTRVDVPIKREAQPPENNVVDSWTSQAPHNQEWNGCQEWLSRSTTPLWESNQQPWENDTTYSVGCTSSLGSILDSVNKILTDPDVTTPPLGLPQYSLTDLQKAMGASDEEMAMLQQLGEGSLQEEYVYDNSKRTPDPAWTEEGPTLMDLDNQEPSTSSANQEVSMGLELRKSETPENEDLRQCRGLMGRPRRLLTDYESREMVCPTCSKHFLGLSALQYHVAWSHCVPVTNSARSGGLKKRALLNGCEEVDRRLVCFVCKEIVSSADLLDAHIQSQHMKKPEISSTVERSDCAEKLKSKMSSALGGLLDRALNNLLGTKSKGSESVDAQPELNSGALQLLGKLCAVKKRTGNDLKLSGGTLQLLGRLRAVKNKDEVQHKVHSNQSLATELRNILNRGKQSTPVNKAALAASVSSPPSLATEVNPINLLDHLAVCSNDVQQRPYGCPICGIRFSIPSTRNRHIARAHGTYGRKYDEEFSQYNSTETSNSDEFENDWRDQMSPSADSGHENNVDGENEINPLCSDCGLSFQSIQEVVQHRKEDHPRRFSAESASSDVVSKGKGMEKCSSLVVKESQVLSSEKEVNKCQHHELATNNKDLSTSSGNKRRGRPARSESVSKSRGRSVKMCHETSKKKHASKKPQAKLESEEQVNEDSEVESVRNDVFKTIEDEAFDKLVGKEKPNDVTFKTESEENLGKPKKIDRRKARLTNMGEEAVRVKAEAALRELNLPKKNKTLISTARWGVNAIKFTKQPYQNLPSVCMPNVSSSKGKFALLTDKKWKSAMEEQESQLGKSEAFEQTESMKSDVYDFFDEDTPSDQKLFMQRREPPYNELEYNLLESLKRKPSTETDLADSNNHKNKLRTDSS